MSPKDDRAGRAPDHQDAEHETEVADAIGDECLLRRLGGAVALNQWPMSR